MQLYQQYGAKRPSAPSECPSTSK